MEVVEGGVGGCETTATNTGDTCYLTSHLPTCPQPVAAPRSALHPQRNDKCHKLK